jgi:phosphatidylglycerophosphate synthase
MNKSDKLKEKIKKADKSRTGGFFYSTERKIIEKWVQKLPLFLTPDRLTFISVFSSFIIGLSYLFSTYNKWWLMLNCLMWFLQWFGDSFDGEVARYRNIQRPRYGYFIDHFFDCFCVFIIIVGLGISPLLKLSTALIIGILYLFLSLTSTLAAFTQGRYKIGWGGVGGTEGRMFMIVINIIVIAIPGFPHNLFTLFGTMFTLVDVCAVIFCLLMSYALVYSVVENLSYLNKIDKKTYKDLTIKEAFEKSVFLNKLKNTDMAKFLNGSLKRKIEKSP